LPTGNSRVPKKRRYDSRSFTIEYFEYVTAAAATADEFWYALKFLSAGGRVTLQNDPKRRNTVCIVGNSMQLRGEA